MKHFSNGLTLPLYVLAASSNDVFWKASEPCENQVLLGTRDSLSSQLQKGSAVTISMDMS